MVSKRSSKERSQDLRPERRVGHQKSLVASGPEGSVTVPESDVREWMGELVVHFRECEVDPAHIRSWNDRLSEEFLQTLDRNWDEVERRTHEHMRQYTGLSLQ